jgi:hypothetical protein
MLASQEIEGAVYIPNHCEKSCPGIKSEPIVPVVYDAKMVQKVALDTVLAIARRRL